MAEIDSYTKLLLHGNGDLSNSHHNLIYNGGVKLDYVSTPVGSGAYYFDRNDEYILINNNNLPLGSSERTVDFWFNLSAMDATEQVAFIYGDKTNGEAFLVSFESSNIKFNTWGGGSYDNSYSFTDTGSWHHAAFVYDGSKKIMFLDGTKLGEEAVTINTGAGNLYVGQRGDSVRYFGGHIVDLRILDVALWSSNFTPPTARAQPDANTVLLLSGSGDYGTTGHSITTYNGVKESSDSYKFASGAFYFDGADDYLSVPDSDDWNFGSGDFCIDCWLKIDSIGTGETAGIFYQKVDSNNRGGFNYTDGTGLVFFARSGGTNTILITSAWEPAIGEWNHVAVTRNEDTFRFFVNGSGIGSDIDTSVFPDYSAIVTIGEWESQYLNGSIDELRVSKGVARWTAAFDVPTTEYGIQEFTVENGEITYYSYGIGNEEKIKAGNQFTKIVTAASFNKIYEGQYETAVDPAGKVYGLVEYSKNADNYTFKFYADQDKSYEIGRYTTAERQESDVVIIGSGIGVGMSGVFSYDLGV